MITQFVVDYVNFCTPNMGGVCKDYNYYIYNLPLAIKMLKMEKLIGDECVGLSAYLEYYDHVFKKIELVNSLIKDINLLKDSDKHVFKNGTQISDKVRKYLVLLLKVDESVDYMKDILVDSVKWELSNEEK